MDLKTWLQAYKQACPDIKRSSVFMKLLETIDKIRIPDQPNDTKAFDAALVANKMAIDLPKCARMLDTMYDTTTAAKKKSHQRSTPIIDAINTITNSKETDENRKEKRNTLNTLLSKAQDSMKLVKTERIEKATELKNTFAELGLGEAPRTRPR